MITFVYCCICLLIVCCQTTRIDSEENDYNNDSPDTSPKVTFLHYKTGSNISMRCDIHHANKENMTWEFKHCKSSFKGTQCDDKSMYTRDYSEGQWKKLDFNRKKRKLEITNATEESAGFYRCLYNDSIIKIYMIGVVVLARYVGPPPEIVSLSSSNSSIRPDSPIVIQCKATSVIPPEIRWFKECSNSLKCEVHSRLPYNGRCYCGIPPSNYAYSTTNNIYVSKLSIYNLPNINSGIYVCLVISVYGEDHKNITIKVEDADNLDNNENTNNSFSLLFLIPLFFMLVPVAIWLVFYRRKRKNRRKSTHFNENEHQKQLIKPVVEI